MKRAITLMLAVLMLLSVFSGCGKKKPSPDNTDNLDGQDAPTKEDEVKGDPKVIRIGTHYIALDPNYVDPITGKSPQKPDNIEGSKRGMEAVKRELNVDVKFVEYKGNIQELLLKSVLANDPMCELAIIPSAVGNVIGQNILQPLDQYVEYFQDPEYSWILQDGIYGHRYLLNRLVDYIRTDALVYNISYLEKIETLKENGEVVLPADLWKQGKWTWTAFKEYLEKVKTYYTNKKAPVRPEVSITAFSTDAPVCAQLAIKSTGETLFGKDGLNLDSDNVKKAVGFVDELYNKKLLTQTYYTSAYTRKNAIRDGETVFSNLPNWLHIEAGAGLVKRGEIMGLVPFPRPDDMDKDDPRYQQLYVATGDTGMLKGISKETSDLAIRTHKMFWYEFFKGRTNSDSVRKYFASKESTKNEAVRYGFDALNEKYGEGIINSFIEYNSDLKCNEFIGLTTWNGDWNKLVRNSILGTDSSPKYDVAIASQKQVFESKIGETQSILSSDKIVDNIPPSVSFVNKDIAIAKGTDVKTIDWSKYIKVVDSVDGDIDIKNATIDASKIKFDTVGFYKDALALSVKDKAGNERISNMSVIIFDPDNKTAPTLTIKEKYRTIKVNEEAKNINWGRDFVDKADSADGFSIKNYITADISSLDVTKAGNYDVTLTATDYAGNKTEVKISVTVEEK